ncbi:NRDE family protein [Dietzia sp. ANT_WB102]|uniref:NRDE family protein n=1 Tax=Dietzia sp. ANT_WB102 TaxID=2597345 RepID=UPI0011F02AB8|nr:NRDE family protein [Dietzia sp. ANT_WB102]KAA0917964.1 NRDE family protein [Dietzia sp. ANT_WB102]
MCMLVIARRVHPLYPLIVVANRDEVLSRPTEPLHEWVADRDGVGGVVAGRDVSAGGTWLAVAPGGRFAAVTNVREAGPSQPAPASRGELPLDALTGPVPVTEFAHHVVDDLDRYGPVNLLAGDLDRMWWASNRSTRGPLPLGIGVHGLSNASLDTPWPKVVGAVHDVRALMSTDAMTGPEWSETLLDVLADRRPASPWKMPRTGVPLTHEWRLSSRFVRLGRQYGTRSTTAVRIDQHGTADVVERTWDARGRVTGTVTERI